MCVYDIVCMCVCVCVCVCVCLCVCVYVCICMCEDRELGIKDQGLGFDTEFCPL